MKVITERGGGAQKKGALLTIKLPHTELPQQMPHSETAEPSNQHWGGKTLHPQRQVW